MKLNPHHSSAAWLLGAALITGTLLAAEAPPAPEPPPAPNAAAIQQQVAAEVAHAAEVARHAQEAVHQAIVIARAAPGEAEEADVLVEPPEPPEPPEMSHFESRLATIVGDPFASENNSSGPLLVAAGLNDEQRGQLTEDLKVMHRILEKAADRAGAGAGANTAMGIAVYGSFGRSAPRTLFLDGFGAVFMLNVKYPLVAPPAKEAEKEEANRPDNSAWEETRRELYGRRDDNPRIGMSAAMAQRYGLVTPDRGPQYNATKVDALKRTLLEAAKNAANIRKLGGDEQVVIVAQGPAAVVRNVEVNKRNSRESVTITAQRGGPQTTLTMRFKKADAEAFSNGKLTADEFAKKVETATY